MSKAWEAIGLKPKAQSVSVPGRSPEEDRLLRQQTAILKQQKQAIADQARLERVLGPYLYEAAGLTPKYSKSGKIIGFDKIVDPGQARRDEIQKLQEERSLAALKGELPVDPALLRNLENEEMTLRETLRKQLGTGYENSDPGIRALDQFRQTKLGALDAARRGDMTLAEQLGLGRLGARTDLDSTLMSRMMVPGTMGQTRFGNSLNLAGAYDLPLKNLFGDRAMQFDANKQYSSQKFASGQQFAQNIWDTAATIGSFGLYGFMKNK